MKEELNIPDFVNSEHKSQPQHFKADTNLSKKHRAPQKKSTEERRRIKGVKKLLKRTALAVLAMGVLAVTPTAISHIAQEVDRIEQTFEENKNRDQYDENNLNEGLYEKLKQECDYYDRILNSDAINTVTKAESFQKIDILRNLYFEIVKSKIAYAYGMNPEEAKKITYKIGKPIRLGEEEIRIDIPGRDSLVNDQIPESLQYMIQNTTNIDVEEYENKPILNTIEDMTYYAGALNKFTKNNNYEVDKNGTFIEVGQEKEK